MKLKYLVVSTGRCGSVYMARFLTNLGISCGHEAIFNWDGLEMARERLLGKKPIQTSIASIYNHITKEVTEGWFDPTTIIAESSYMAVPYLNEPILEDVKIIHLVRSPLKVLSSWVLDLHFFDNESRKGLKNYRQFIYSHIPQIKEEPTEIEKACRYLIEWTKLIEKSRKDKIIVKIENWPYKNMMDFLDISYPKNPFENKKINSWKTRTKNIKLNDIPHGKTKNEFKNLIEKYNYNNFLML